jgi:endonuclease/exonuclease/phosphatase family metal-dependent hydrolase
VRLDVPLPVLNPRQRWARVDEPIVAIDSPRRALEHSLAPVLPRWSFKRSRRRLERDPEFVARRRDVAAVLEGFDWDQRAVTATAALARPLRAVAWNVERGKRFEALCGVLEDEPMLRDADVMLLSEVDWGMGRSGNRHVTRDLAARLGMGYVFVPAHLVLSRGDVGELHVVEPNRESLHGIALLSRFPVRRIVGVPLPEYVDKFKVLEKRLGWKRALVAEIELPDGPLTVAAVHLDPFSPPRHRARQIRMVLRAIERFGNERVLLGGDLNTTTYDLGSAPGLAVNLAYKLVRFGFEGTLRHYMTPDEFFERKIFRSLARSGLRVEGFTDPNCGTIYYDLNDPEVVAKSLEFVPEPVFRWLQRRLRPWGGKVPLRFDWFAGRGLVPRGAWVIEEPAHAGVRVSDHNPLVVDVDPLPPRSP